MKLMILDGNSIVNRAFYGVRPLSAPDGTPTNAVFGFLNIWQRIYEDEKPDALCVSFDLKAPTFRHLRYEGYKAQRKGMPDELRAQMPVLKELLDAMGIRRYELEGYEADDILGTVSRICEEQGWDCTVVTGDKDSLQLVSEHTTVCNVKTVKGQTETILYTPERFREEYGFAPMRMVDLKSLMGDSSDNIPGVPGIGEKTALSLVQNYDTLDAIYEKLPELAIKDGVRKKLAAGEESARLSYWLATIDRNIPLAFSPEENRWNKSYTSTLLPLLRRLGFQKFIEKWCVEEYAPQAEETAEEASHLPARSVGPEELPAFEEALSAAELVAVEADELLDRVEVCDGKSVYSMERCSLFLEYDALLERIFSAGTKKLGHNIKDLMRRLLSQGCSTDGFVFDTALAAYLMDATGSDYSLRRLTMGFFGEELSGTEAIFRLYAPMQKKLDEMELRTLYETAELPLCEVLAQMEHTGFLVDRKALAEFGESLNGAIDALHDAVCEYAGHEFNINSPKQLGEVLFDELMLPFGKKTKSGWSTNAEVLDKLRGKHPIVDAVLEYRTLTKLKSTYADGLLKVISPDGRIHTSFQMTVTATGRLSSTEPNLQNIPIRKKQGAQIRRMFIASPGMTLVDADYSQIELRLLSHISGDTAMQEAFLSGEDFHTVTAARVFSLPVDEVTPILRSRAKAVNFGIVYGISAFSLSQDIHVSTKEAQEYIDAYFDRYPGVRDYMKNVVEEAKLRGYVTTLYGRRRDVPELRSANFNMRSFGERVALNMPVQGTAADIIKLAMVNVYRRLQHEGLRARLILQVHDELIVECPEEEAAAVSALLREEMENAAHLAVPLTADCKEGHCWADAH